MAINLAYLAGGKLHLKLGDGPVQHIESRFAEQVRRRAFEMQKRNDWKTQGSGARFMRGGALWGVRDYEAAEMSIAITGVTGCGPAEMAYTLQTPEVSGVFLLKQGGAEEQRLLHTADFTVGQVSASSDRLAFVVRHKGGGSNIGVMSRDGSGFMEVTEGDTIDLAPRWMPGSNRELVFQSAGIGRNQAGIRAGQGPFSIQKLDIESGRMETIAEDPSFDLLSPQIASDGSLYCVRRPYQGTQPKINPFRAVLDLLLLPFRLLFAVFQYLNFFTAKYTGKTLTNAGGVRQREADIRQMMIWGNLQIAQQPRTSGNAEESLSLVPDSWKLVRQRAGGEAEVVTSKVLAFDLLPDSSIIYSDGAAVYYKDVNGNSQRLLKDAFIHHVAAIKI